MTLAEQEWAVHRGIPALMPTVRYANAVNLFLFILGIERLATFCFLVFSMAQPHLTTNWPSASGDQPYSPTSRTLDQMVAQVIKKLSRRHGQVVAVPFVGYRFVKALRRPQMRPPRLYLVCAGGYPPHTWRALFSS